LNGLSTNYGLCANGLSTNYGLCANGLSAKLERREPADLIGCLTRIVLNKCVELDIICDFFL